MLVLLYFYTSVYDAGLCMSYVYLDTQSIWQLLFHKVLTALFLGASVTGKKKKSSENNTILLSAMSGPSKWYQKDWQ